MPFTVFGILKVYFTKTKGFSRETEALKLVGGGENRTLVLRQLHKCDYMLSALFFTDSLAIRHPTWGCQAYRNLEKSS